ncbi:MAG TPA: PorP/SprF family type IX secretion system membrane protein [Bacteroidia bacterium]|jgi:type IX secretion system PorP/SprF family membrane protein|nr:PorP/SprF family type IX secretion system membrane protein [Bacteroidia bacterium]
MKKLIISLLILGATSNYVFAQDPAFSRVYANPLYLNPAFTGTDTNQRICLNYRGQWPNIPGYNTYNMSYDRNFIDSSDGIGILANQDRAGGATIITNNISLLYAHQFHIKSFTLSAGVQFTWHNIILNQSNLAFGDMIDPRRGFIFQTNERFTDTNKSVFDISAGILGYGKNYFVGFAIDHITQPDESFVSTASPLPMKFVLNGGVMIHAGGFIISPTVLYIKQQDFNTEVIECYLTRWHFTLGIGYRVSDAIIFTLGYQSKYIHIGYSYDYTISMLTNMVTGGTHEGSIGVMIPYKSSKFKKTNGINCPLF